MVIAAIFVSGPSVTNQSNHSSLTKLSGGTNTKGRIVIDDLQATIDRLERKFAATERLNAELMDSLYEQRVHFQRLIEIQKADHEVQMNLKDSTIRHLRGLLSCFRTQTRTTDKEVILMGTPAVSQDEELWSLSTERQDSIYSKPDDLR